MPPTPTAQSLLLCEKAITDRETGQVTLVAEFDRLVVPALPTTVSFAAFARLGDSEGRVEGELIITELATEEEIFRKVRILTFPNRLTDVRFIMRVTECEIERPGTYEASLLIDGKWVASRSFGIRQARGRNNE